MFKKLRFLYIGLFLCIVFSSCVTQKRCFELFPPDTITTVTTAYRDTILPIFIPGTPIIIGQVPITISDTAGQDVSGFLANTKDTLKVNSGTAHAEVWVENNILKAKIRQVDSTYTRKYDSLQTEITIRDTQIYTIQARCEKGKAERFVDKLIILLGIVFGGILIIQLIKLFK